MFLHRCILAFNLLSLEGASHLLTSIEMYCKEAISSYPPYESPHLDDSSNDLETPPEYENMELENLVFEKVTEEIEARQRSGGSVSFHLHAPKALIGLVEDIEVPGDPEFKHGGNREDCHYAHPTISILSDLDPTGGLFLQTNWQIQGFLQEQADALEKQGSSFPLNAFELMLRQLQKLAPELHHVHFLRYLNGLYHDDFFAALENAHCYFDYRMKGFDLIPPASGCNSLGRYEIALHCLGMMHFHFGHPKQALEVLTEAVHISLQQSNDTCLAYTLAAICNLLSETSLSSTTGILGSSYLPLTRIGISLSVEQQLFVLLRGSLKRAENLKLKRLVASNHLAMPKFDLTFICSMCKGLLFHLGFNEA